VFSKEIFNGSIQSNIFCEKAVTFHCCGTVWSKTSVCEAYLVVLLLCCQHESQNYQEFRFILQLFLNSPSLRHAIFLASGKNATKGLVLVFDKDRLGKSNKRCVMHTFIFISYSCSINVGWYKRRSEKSQPSSPKP